MTKYYKVVANIDNKLQSACRHINFPEEFRVTYEIGKWIEPRVKGTRLFIFKDFDCAKKFASDNWGEVYECEVKNPRKDQVARLAFIHHFWIAVFEARKKKVRFRDTIKNMLMYNQPNGTYSAIEIKLIRKVQ
jgi:hypothetical protein